MRCQVQSLVFLRITPAKDLVGKFRNNSPLRCACRLASSDVINAGGCTCMHIALHLSVQSLNLPIKLALPCSFKQQQGLITRAWLTARPGAC